MQTTAGRIFAMTYSWKGHKDRNRHKKTTKRSGQARLVYVKGINRNIPTTWRWTRGDYRGRRVIHWLILHIQRPLNRGDHVGAKHMSPEQSTGKSLIHSRHQTMWKRTGKRYSWRNHKRKGNKTGLPMTHRLRVFDALEPIFTPFKSVLCVELTL